jgi:tripartite-type tricarboxylate transporter receptor subunit TctC
LFVTSGHAGAQALFPSLRFDTVKDFAPVIALAQSPVVVLVKGDAPYGGMTDLVGAMKDKPGRLNYGTGGGGSTLTALSAMLLKREIGFDAVMVPFTGSGPANLALLGGNIDFQFDIVSSAVGLLADGKVRALAVTTAQRSRAIPDVPTIGETVRPGFDVSGWFGILAPAGTDPALVQRYNAAFNAVLADPAIRQRLTALGIDPIGGSPQDFSRFLEAETTRWGGLIRDLGLKAE